MEEESFVENNSTQDGFNLSNEGSTTPSDTNKKVKFMDNNKNNQQHIVPIGLLIVLVTIYLGLSGLQRCFVNCSENETIPKSAQNLLYENNDIKDPQVILERLLEYKDICKDLEIFTKEINKTKQNKVAETKQTSLEIENSGSGSGHASIADGSGEECTSSSKSYTKNANKHDKKDMNINKKNSSAEPIIYLFALVFIYLLIKAASDINQHYKSENKNDKRFMRRCSLQSYAQAHRDRRSSKANNLFTTKINPTNNNNTIRIGIKNKTTTTATTHIGIIATLN
ncbi:uncharacterized protein [Musca autumnalis]|uniref:uncharacterized protein n=1 Tax=Musca autumnalis TaxID=221902 RepID=UPI003CEFF61F